MIRSAAIRCLPIVLATAGGSPAETRKPSRAILFVIDGMHWQAPKRLGLTNVLRLADEGTWVTQAYCILPAHPTTGPYGKLHTTSLPNATLQSGTLFIGPGTRMVQECFFPKRLTAHGVNITAYRSLNRGFSYSMMLNGGPDAAVVDWGIDLFKRADIRFARLHLQDAGSAGAKCTQTKDDVPWRRNIWGQGSPYVSALRNADTLLGRLVDALKQMGKWSDTLLIVMADHGQATTGWHPPSQEDGWITPLIFVGPGVARGRVLEYAEHIDVVPTLCDLMGVEPPCKGPGSGVVLNEIKVCHSGKSPARPQRVRIINRLIRDYLLLQGKMRVRVPSDPSLERAIVLAERQFYGVDRILDWHEAGTLDQLIQTNRSVIEQIRQALLESTASK